MPAQRKFFAIEKSWAEQASRRGDGPNLPDPAPTPVAAVVDNDEVIHAIGALSERLDRFLSVDHTEIERIRIEVADIAGRIQATKAEIAALRHPLEPNDKFQTAAAELGAVVTDAESATHTIMNQAERVDEIVGELRSHVDDAFGAARLADAAEAITRIFEACNFQDLTGQRITKVMTTMRFIEQHINAMMEIWGGVDAIRAHAPAIVDTREGDAKLLNGPKLDGDVGHASQDDIDALFD